MANPEESSPLLKKDNQVTIDGEKKSTAATTGVPAGVGGWTAEGLPAIRVMGEPMPTAMGGRTHWDSSLLACLGRNDHFCTSDLEVCMLGSVAPCVLYGANAERLGAEPGTFTNHCLPYSCLYVLGNALFGGNWLAPWFSYPSRSAIRQRFNLEGSCEAFIRSCGCCGSLIEDEVQREQCESGCDFATHLLCHPCALCQEGRELRRRLPHPGFSAQHVLVMIPPGDQSMARP